MIFYPILADMEGCRNNVFSSQAMSHCYKLWYRAFGASFSYNFWFSLSKFLFWLYLNIKKVILLLNGNNFFSVILPLIYQPVLLGDPRIRPTRIYHNKAASVWNILTFSWEAAILFICSCIKYSIFTWHVPIVSIIR